MGTGLQFGQEHGLPGSGELGTCLQGPGITVHAVLVRCKLKPGLPLGPGRRRTVRRYEHDTSGAMLHVDVTKFGNVPDGRWAPLRRPAARRPEPGRDRRPHWAAHPQPQRKIGTAYVHRVLDDHSRVAYPEIHDDETAATAIAVLRRAVAWFAARGVKTQRVLSDNGSCYRSQGPTHYTLDQPSRAVQLACADAIDLGSRLGR